MKYLFRGYDIIGDKGWVFGDLVHNQKVTQTGLEPRTMVGGYEVAADSVGLFTGVKDMNGNDIYEGDIVECVSWNELFSDGNGPMKPFRRVMYVALLNGGFKMVEQMPEPMTDNLWDIIYNGDIIVKGNIYENKTLSL